MVEVGSKEILPGAKLVLPLRNSGSGLLLLLLVLLGLLGPLLLGGLDLLVLLLLLLFLLLLEGGPFQGRALARRRVPWGRLAVVVIDGDIGTSGDVVVVRLFNMSVCACR
jgi:hypothetical protein